MCGGASTKPTVTSPYLATVPTVKTPVLYNYEKDRNKEKRQCVHLWLRNKIAESLCHLLKSHTAMATHLP